MDFQLHRLTLRLVINPLCEQSVLFRQLVCILCVALRYNNKLNKSKIRKKYPIDYFLLIKLKL